MTFIDGDYYESLADLSFGDMYSSNFFQPNYSSIKNCFDKFENPIFFIETHRIPYLFHELNNFSDKCRVIAHNSDYTFGSEILPHIPKNVERIWCQNYNYQENDLIKSLPIGLERKRWFPEQRKQELLMEVNELDIERTELVYMNFDPKTNPIRNSIFQSLKDKSFINDKMVGNGGNYKEYLMDLKRHKFVISPPGNGIDCHRNWEALMMGCVPIVLDSPFIKNVYGSMSLIIDNYSTLDEQSVLSFETSIDMYHINSKYTNIFQ